MNAALLPALPSVELCPRAEGADCYWQALFPSSDLDLRHTLRTVGFGYDARRRIWCCPGQADSVPELVRAALAGSASLIVTKKPQPGSSLAQPKPAAVTEAELTLTTYAQALAHQGYSAHSQRNYLSEFRRFVAYHAPCLPTQLGEVDVEAYLQHLHATGHSETQRNTCINAVKFYFEHVDGGPRRVLRIARPRRRQTLPVVLDKDEVRRLLEAPANLKHRCILTVAYAGGLRVSEVANLTFDDLDPAHQLLWVRGCNGTADRTTPLSSRLVMMLREYQEAYRPTCWLFEGQHGERYSARSMQEIVRAAAARAGIQSPVTMHTLRHSFAAHLLAAGTDLRFLQELLGHHSVRTTQLYTQLPRTRQPVSSPLDTL